MATPYSHRFALAIHAFTGGVDNLYTVPANSVAVIRDVEWIPLAGGGFVETIANATAGWFRQNAVVALQSYQWQGRVVLNAGETLDCAGTATTSAAVIISGYLLTS